MPPKSPKSPGIADVRKAIDESDDILLKALAARFRAIRYLAELKKSAKIAIEDPSREQELKSRWKFRAQTLDIPEELALLILDLILAASKRLQQS